MMQNYQAYVSRKPNADGTIVYTPSEDALWATLFEKQNNAIGQYACQEYMDGLRQLNLPCDRVPQLAEVSAVLRKETGWSVVAVPALISFKRFFDLLADKKFPAATFIRRPEHLEYLQEPDIFHEIYGHCPLLTNPIFADFVQAYGKISASANEKDQVLLARLYWFTVEFGLIQSSQGLRCYGAGLLSSMGETTYSVESTIPMRKPFSIFDALRTPYRIDIFQTVYFVIDDFQQLYDLVKHDLLLALQEARRLGEFPPTYPLKEST